ncbi:MAG TPA: hypothetical protein VG815_09580 [Chloroflexota bacterium]|nr:hypothetical protein [Chloroflexota bacterium]
MSADHNEIVEPWWSRYKWLLPIILALIIALIVFGVVLASHVHDAKPKPTATPTPTTAPASTKAPTATATATPGPRVKASPTASTAPTPTRPVRPTKVPTKVVVPTRVVSPTHAATPTKPPKPTATPTPSLSPIPTVVGLHLGYIRRSQTKIQQIQAEASQGQLGYKVYLTGVQALASTLQSYGFTGNWQIIQPAQPSPTPTIIAKPYVTRGGIPAEKYIVRYQGHTYQVILEQLAQKGPGGIWLIWQVGPQLT